MPSISNPMQQALFRGCVECIRMLIETQPFYSVDSVLPDGLTPICIAAREGHIQTLRFLSSAGACLQQADIAGCTALHHAASAGQLRAVRWLLRHGAKILLDKRGRSPIQIAADHDHMEIVNVLAKHATSSESLIPKDVNDKCENKTAKSLKNNNNNSEYSTDYADDYSFNSSSTHNRHIQATHQDSIKPFSHLHVSSESPSKISTSPAESCSASSSGNSSLSASTSAPSLSPSSSSAVSCGGCSTSDETTLLKSVSDLSDAFTLAEYQTSESYQTSDNSLLSSAPSPFYLHPPNANPSKESSVSNSSRIDFGTNSAECGKGILKKSQHKRQPSSSSVSTSPFFLHPPENLISETQKAVIGKMAPAPVNSSHSHHHFADPCHESTPKLKIGLAESSSSSSTSSPPQTPPGTKSGMASTISECISKFQTEKSSQQQLNKSQLVNKNEVKFKNEINTNNTNSNSCIPPPPPPPPFPGMIKNEPHIVKAQCPLPNLPAKPHEVHFAIDEKNTDSDEENDYEDIDEIANGKNQFEQSRKLLRSVSAPPPPTNENNQTGGGGAPTDILAKPEKISNKPSSMGCGKAGGFIPPHFPTPPQDALIKPSEYLKSIQNKSKPNSNNTGSANNGNSVHRPCSRVEETIRALGVDSGVMSPVPEETNAEDEFEEINPERVKLNETSNNDDENNNTLVIKGSCGVGMIKAEELMKVHLRKTPMSRTKSAPLVLGRVISDDPVDQPQSPTVDANNHENEHEPLKRTNTMSPPPTDSGGGVSKADVIAELAQSAQSGGVRKWKEELKRRQKEQEKAVQKEIEQFYQPVNFVSEVPATDVNTGEPIAMWRRQLMAKKAAERAKKEAEEQIRLDIEAKRRESIPMWRQQLLQRQKRLESDEKYAH